LFLRLIQSESPRHMRDNASPCLSREDPGKERHRSPLSRVDLLPHKTACGHFRPAVGRERDVTSCEPRTSWEARRPVAAALGSTKRRRGAALQRRLRRDALASWLNRNLTALGVPLGLLRAGRPRSIMDRMLPKYWSS
jgi:hypothetical protein